MEDIQKLINELGGEQYKDKETEHYSEEAAELLIGKIDNKSKEKTIIESNTLIFKTLADWSKVEDNRETIIRSPSNVVKKTLGLFEFLLPNGVETLNTDTTVEQSELFSMICRLIGNLTYENPPNREFIFDKSPCILKYISNFISQTKYQQLQRTSCAATANLSSETDYIQLEFFKLGVVTTLIDLICRESTSDEVSQMAIKAFNNLVDNEITQADIHFKEIHKLLGQLKKSLNKEGYYENSFANDLVSSLSTLSLNKDLQKEILKEGFLNDLIELIEESNVHREMINEFEDDDIEKDKDISIAPSTSELIFKLADNDDYRQYFYNKERDGNNASNILDRMIKIMTAPPPTYKDGDSKAQLKALDVAKVKKNITKTIALCSLEDDVIDKFIKTPKIFVDLLVDTEDTERIVNGEMIIGNLARSEPNCRLLNSYNVIELIADIMKKFPNFQPIQHLGLSSIRNLTLPNINKGFKPSETLMEDVVFNSKVHNQVIQFASLSLIKNFIGSDQSNFKLFIEFPNALQSLLDLANGRIPASIEESDDQQEQLQLDDAKIQEIEEKFEEKQQENQKETTAESGEKKQQSKKDMRVIYEATRLLLRFLENSELSTNHQEKMKQLVKESVEPFFSLLQSPFPILQVEGAKGLVLIIKQDKDLLLSRPQWIKDLVEVLSVSIIPFQQLSREQSTISSDPNHQKLLAQIQSNCNFSTELQTTILSNIFFNLSLDESICKKMKDQNIISELKTLKSKQDAPQLLSNLIQKILVQLTI
ncbi:hypothetical protein RB653_008825 [Dictyostelium firmibasis]|uniref:Armadillo-type fold n=1 Tax=Dictyostelium firmibasis TaxID=79012 RepID=A0AAN7U0U0_9MYCE